MYISKIIEYIYSIPSFSRGLRNEASFASEAINRFKRKVDNIFLFYSYLFIVNKSQVAAFGRQFTAY